MRSICITAIIALLATLALATMATAKTIVPDSTGSHVVGRHGVIKSQTVESNRLGMNDTAYVYLADTTHAPLVYPVNGNLTVTTTSTMLTGSRVIGVVPSRVTWKPVRARLFGIGWLPVVTDRVDVSIQGGRTVFELPKDGVQKVLYYNYRSRTTNEVRLDATIEALPQYRPTFLPAEVVRDSVGNIIKP